MNFEFRPTVKRLLRDSSQGRVRIVYLTHEWTVPSIGHRPPYYTNPRYDAYYPLV